MRRGIREFAGTVAVFAALAASGALRAQTAPGPIRLFVDASQAPQKILHSHMQIPVQPGAMVLYYPQWIPGEHMPDGPIINVAGFKLMAGGKELRWQRDLVDMFALHVDIPQGVTSLNADFDFLLSSPVSGFSAGASATAYLDVLSWNQLLFYPKGYAARDLTFVPSLKLPAGWNFGTALPGAKQNGDTITFDPVPLNTLVDSPVLAGRYFKAIQLTPGAAPSHELDIAADRPSSLIMPPEMEVHFHDLVEQAFALFGVRHYRNYHFLVTLSDDVAHFGLEHHESSDDRTAANSLTDEAARNDFADLLPHEFVHSWNGKYRRPADLATPDFQTPMKDDLLWVYEGLTEYLGEVLTTRSGLRTPEVGREELAYVAATYGNEPGRRWRPLQDTATSAVFLYNAGDDWSNWRRSVDFYQEGELLWLDVDATIRGLTKDKKSMNDFCRAFYAGPGGEPALKTYTFDDLVSALNNIAPYDWSAFLHQKLDSLAPNTADESVTKSGWKIAYNEQPNEFEQTQDAVRKQINLELSIGMTVSDEGLVVDVIHESKAYEAGIAPGMKITAVEGHQFTPEGLKDAIDAAKSNTAPIELIIANGVEIHTYTVDYHGGLRYPHLERNNDVPDYLSEIYQPLTP